MRRLFAFLPIVCIFAIGFLHAAGRENMLLQSGWQFTQGDAQGAERPDYDAADWQPVSLPHNWGWEQAQKGENYLCEPGWYRRDLNIGKPEAGRCYFLRFEAAGSVAAVYLNGKLLGEHRGAFGAFCFEITHALASSGTNLLAVRVSNAPDPDLAPLSGDFPVYGGLYRPVHLIETADENFTLTDHASSGVAWLQMSVNETQTVLEVAAQISNGTKRNQPLTFVASALDARGNRVAGSEEQITLMPGVTAPFLLRVVVPQPHLWNGRKDPYLYRAVRPGHERSSHFRPYGRNNR
jgi:beta-galactosidase